MPLPALFVGGVWTAIWTFMATTAPWLAKKILIGLGFGLVVFSGVDLAIDSLESWVFARFDNISTDLFAVLVLMDIDTGIAILFASMAARIAIQTTIAAKKLVIS